MTCAGPGTSGPSRDRCSAHTGSGSDSAVSAPTWALPPARRKAPGPAPDAPGDPGTGPRPASRSTAKATTSALRIARQPSKILKSQAQATLDEMLAFAKARHAFGRPVGTFQALAHAMADLQVEIDSARLLAYRAAWLLAQGQPCGREGSMAKLKGSETYVAAARLGMQVCAGHGFSTESVMSFRYRESIVATISGGTSQIQRNGIARSMGLRAY